MVKDLSDNNPLVTILIVGIGDNVIQLIGEHPSVARCLGQIKLPRMSEREVGKIIDIGMEYLDMSIDLSVKQDVIRLSQGFPYYTHLIMEYLTLKTLNTNSVIIKKQHLSAAIFEAVNDVDQVTKHAYEKAIDTNNGDDYKEILYICASLNGDEQGRFKCSEVLDKYEYFVNNGLSHSQVLYRLNKLCGIDKGGILEKATKMKYRFRNPLVKAYINIKKYNESSSSQD